MIAGLRSRVARAIQVLAGAPRTAPFFLRDNPAFGRFDVGEFSYGSPMVHGDPAHATLRVGRYCSIADEVTIFLGAEHRVDWVTTYPFTVLDPAFRDVPGHPATKGDVVIGNDVWIGFGALILSGVTIGDGAVIGARSVVTRDVPPYAIAGGNPSRVLRARFSEQEVQDLLRIRWWDWDRARVNASMPLLLSGNVGEFIRRVDAGLA